MFIQEHGTGAPLFGGGINDGFIAEFESGDNSLYWSTFYGGIADDRVKALGTGSYGGNQYVFAGGWTYSNINRNIPLKDLGGNAYWQPAQAGTPDGTMARFEANAGFIMGNGDGTVNKSNTFTIFPNPGHDKIYIKIPDAHNQKIELLNMKGQVLISTIADNHRVQLNCAKLSPGIYVIKIGEDSQKFIKR